VTSPFSTGRRGVRYGGGTSASGAPVQVAADDFYRLSKALKVAGQTGLRKELHKSVVLAAKPLIPKVREAARRDLPKHGGLNERIARKPYRAQARTGVTTAGVRIVGTKVDPRINSQGRIAHPVFGRPGSTVVQQVPEAKGYFDETLSESAPLVRAGILAVLSQFPDRIVAQAKGR
jgi:hypothetical protein